MVDIDEVRPELELLSSTLKAMKKRLEGGELTPQMHEMFKSMLQVQTIILDMILDR